MLALTMMAPVVHCRHSKAPFTFVVQIMVPQSPPLSITAAWSADINPAVAGKASSIAGSEATSPGGQLALGCAPDVFGRCSLGEPRRAMPGMSRVVQNAACALCNR